MANILGLTTMLAAAATLVWSGALACRIKNRFVKWGVMGLTAALAVAVSFAAALTIVGTVKLHARSAPVPDLEVEATPERIGRGKALVDGFCSACHSRTGTLTGGLRHRRALPTPHRVVRFFQPDPGGAVEALVRRRDLSRDS